MMLLCQAWLALQPLDWLSSLRHRIPDLLIENVGWTLLQSVWQFALIAAGLWLCLRVLAHRDPRLRYLAASTALVSVVLLAAITLSRMQLETASNIALPQLPASSLPAAEIPQSFGASNSTSGAAIEYRSAAAAAASAPASDTSDAPHAESDWSPAEISARWIAWIEAVIASCVSTSVAIWLAGVLLLSLRPLIGGWWLRRLRQSGMGPPTAECLALLQVAAGRLGIRRHIEVAQSALVEVPTVLGAWRPLILLPASVATGLTSDQLQALLFHELAHVRRHDYLVNIAQVWVETIFFYHPAVWWISRQMRIEREHCCDDLAVGASADRACYAQALLAIEGLRTPRTALALSASNGSLVARIRRLAQAPRQQPKVPTWPGILLLATMASLAILAGTPPIPQTRAATKAAPAEKSADRRFDAAVRGPQGGLAGAKVAATFYQSNDSQGGLTLAEPDNELAKVEYVADGEGRYQIQTPEKLASLKNLHLSVTITHPGYLTRTIGPVPLLIDSAQQTHLGPTGRLNLQFKRQALFDARLRPGVALEDHIVLPDGTPAAGATVTVRTKYRAYSWKFGDRNEYFASDTAVTDADGRFSVLRDNPATMTVELPGYAPLIVDQLQNNIRPTEFRLPKPIRLRGRVHSVDGQPIVGAIVVANREIAWNEFDMPVSFARKAATNERGEYELPPLPANRYRLSISSRVTDASQIANFNQAQQSAPIVGWQASSAIPTIALSDIILDQTAQLRSPDDAARVDFQGVADVSVTAQVNFPDGRDVSEGRNVDLTVHGQMNGERWVGHSATADEQGRARLIVPRGVRNLVVGTGLARWRRSTDAPEEIGSAIHLGTADDQISGLVVTRPRLARLNVQLKLPANLDRQYAESKAFINIYAYHLREGFAEHHPARQRIGLVGATQTNADQYRGLALPNETIVLEVTKTVDKLETTLHEERLILTPGEELLRTIEIQDR